MMDPTALVGKIKNENIEILDVKIIGVTSRKGIGRLIKRLRDKITLTTPGILNRRTLERSLALDRNAWLSEGIMGSKKRSKPIVRMRMRMLWKRARTVPCPLRFQTYSKLTQKLHIIGKLIMLRSKEWSLCRLGWVTWAAIPRHRLLGVMGTKRVRSWGDHSRLNNAMVGMNERLKGNSEVKNLERSFADLIKKNMDLEDKFDRVANFLVRVMHLMTTTLYLMQTNKDGATEEKKVETIRSLYGFLADDWLCKHSWRAQGTNDWLPSGGVILVELFSCGS